MLGTGIHAYPNLQWVDENRVSVGQYAREDMPGTLPVVVD